MKSIFDSLDRPRLGLQEADARQQLYPRHRPGLLLMAAAAGGLKHKFAAEAGPTIQASAEVQLQDEMDTSLHAATPMARMFGGEQ